MRTHKILCVVAYDVADTKRRNKIIKIIEKYGHRINYSVYECMFTPAQFDKVRQAIQKNIFFREDVIAIYPICLDCYARAVYLPPRDDISDTVSIFG